MSSRRRTNISYASSTTEEEEGNDAIAGQRCNETSYVRREIGTTGDDAVPTGRRRGRGPSKRPCLNRNALMARENRQRKKAYLEKIENKLSFYQEENKHLVNTIHRQGIDIKRLTAEVNYLKGVLNNNTSITSLLRAVNYGLTKLNCQKRKVYGPSDFPDNLQKVDNSEWQQCSCIVDSKENLFEREAFNQTATLNNRRHICKNQARKVSQQISESDHTYTAPKYFLSNDGTKESEEMADTMETDALSQLTANNYLDNDKCLPEMDMIPETSCTPVTQEAKKDSQSDFDQLPLFNSDIFDDIPKCDDIMNSIDDLQDTSNLFNEDDLFQSLNNAGICLHQIEGGKDRDLPGYDGCNGQIMDISKQPQEPFDQWILWNQ